MYKKRDDVVTYMCAYNTMGCAQCNPGVSVVFDMFVPLYTGGRYVFVEHVEVCPPSKPVLLGYARSASSICC